MRILHLLTLALLLAVTSSCLTEATAVLAPEVPAETEEPTVAYNFTFNDSGMQVNNGYVLTSPLPEDRGFVHHLILTTEDVSAATSLRGTSAAFTVSVYSEDGDDFSGNYKIGGDHLVPGNASSGHFYRELQFNTDRNYSELTYLEGEITLQMVGEEYLIDYETVNDRRLHSGNGSFQGKMKKINVGTDQEINESVFQGPNNLKYGDREVVLNHAYLKPHGAFANGEPRYRLYFSENEIAPDASNLTGRSDLIFFYVGESFNGTDGKHTFDQDSRDFVSSLVSGVHSAYYCKNMDFTANQADIDEAVTFGEVIVDHNGGDVRIAFSGQSSNRVAIGGIYRGAVLRLD